MYQERHGWERPGWFSYQPNVEAKPYDWYGAYGNDINNGDSYKKLLNLDYTFEYPPMHENVSLLKFNDWLRIGLYCQMIMYDKK